MTFVESLRSYANWCDANPKLQQSVTICIYGATAKKAKAIMMADSSAKLDLLRPDDKIVYLTQTFGELTVKHVLHKSKVCNLAIVDNQVVSVLKPEFAEVVGL
jgi:hypothetical protein